MITIANNDLGAATGGGPVYQYVITRSLRGLKYVSPVPLSPKDIHFTNRVASTMRWLGGTFSAGATLAYLEDKLGSGGAR